MRINLRAGAVLLAVSSVLAGPGHADRAEDEAALRALKTETWPAIYASYDAEALKAFLADDFVLIAGGEVTPKAEEVAWLAANGYTQPADFAYHVIDVIMISDDAAIVYGRGTSTRENEDGTPCAHAYLSSNTLRRTADGWHPVTSHVSDAECTPIAAE